MRQAAFFPSGDDAIDPNTYEAIDKIADTIRRLPNPVRLEGHTDSRPIHTARFRSNWELSAARGIAMLELLSTRCNIPRERLADRRLRRHRTAWRPTIPKRDARATAVWTS